jgi:hypothetical protein
MNYQDIQDWASEIAEIEIGTSCVSKSEIWKQIQDVGASNNEIIAIKYLSKQYVASALDAEIDWDEVENKVQEILK